MEKPKTREEMKNKLLTIKEASDVVGLCPRHIYRVLKSGNGPKHEVRKRGRNKILIDAIDLYDWADIEAPSDFDW